MKAQDLVNLKANLKQIQEINVVVE